MVVQVASFASVQGRWKGGFVCFCAGKVIRAAERDSGSDPLLPVLAQKGQTPSRAVLSSESLGRPLVAPFCCADASIPAPRDIAWSRDDVLCNIEAGVSLAP